MCNAMIWWLSGVEVGSGGKWPSGRTKGPGGSEVCWSQDASERELDIQEVVLGKRCAWNWHYGRVTIIGNKKAFDRNLECVSRVQDKIIWEKHAKNWGQDGGSIIGMWVKSQGIETGVEVTVSLELKPLESMCVRWWPKRPKMTTAVTGSDAGAHSFCISLPCAPCHLVI